MNILEELRLKQLEMLKKTSELYDIPIRSKKWQQLKRQILSIVVNSFVLSAIGFLIIFASSIVFGETEMWSWQMWCQIIGMAIGGIVLIWYGKEHR